MTISSLHIVRRRTDEGWTEGRREFCGEQFRTTEQLGKRNCTTVQRHERGQMTSMESEVLTRSIHPG